MNTLWTCVVHNQLKVSMHNRTTITYHHLLTHRQLADMRMHHFVDILVAPRSGGRIMIMSGVETFYVCTHNFIHILCFLQRKWCLHEIKVTSKLLISYTRDVWVALRASAKHFLDIIPPQAGECGHLCPLGRPPPPASACFSSW